MLLAYSLKDLNSRPTRDYFSHAKSLKIARKRARRLFLLYALFSFKGILNMVKEAFFLWIDF